MVIAQAAFVHDSRAEVLDHYVGIAHQFNGDVTPFVGAQIQRYASLVAVQAAESRGIVSLAPSAKRVSPFRLFDLDDFRSHIRQQLRRKRAGDITRCLHDIDTRKSSSHTIFLTDSEESHCFL